MENGLTALLISDEAYPLDKLDEEEKDVAEANDEEDEEVDDEEDEEEEEVPAEINLIPIEENSSTSTRTRRQQKEQLAPPSGRDKIECPFCKMTCMRRGIVQARF